MGQAQPDFWGVVFYLPMHVDMIASVLQALDAAFNLHGGESELCCAAVRHPLGGGESERPVGQETSAAVADEEWQGEVWQGQLLPVRPCLRKGHQGSGMKKGL